eukprot:SAG11_NODE_11372_length_765_cov_1.127628_1_plen_42_part_01
MTKLAALVEQVLSTEHGQASEKITGFARAAAAAAASTARAAA